MEKTQIHTQKEFEENAFKYQDRYFLEKAIVKCDISLFVSQNGKISIDFKDVIFEGRIRIEKVGSIANVLINNCEFYERFDLNSSTNLMSFSVEKNVFRKEVNFCKSNFSTISVNNGVIQINGNNFLGECKFDNSIFGEKCLINENTFDNCLSFIESEFRKDANFSFNILNYGANFEKAVFKERFIGNNLSGFNKKVDFSYVTFIKDSFLTQAIFFGGLSLYATILKENLEITDLKVYGNQTDRETLRILKNLALKNNNRIQALNFHEKEMNAYRKDLKIRKNLAKIEIQKIKANKDINSQECVSNLLEQEDCLKDYKRDSIILWLNKITNNYGLSWLKALRFILISSVVLYLIYILTFIFQNNYPYTFGWNGWSEFLNSVDYTSKHYFEFLYPVHKFDFISEAESSTLSYFIDFISRIVIGFGIYQMIQAFRKFGKI